MAATASLCGKRKNVNVIFVLHTNNGIANKFEKNLLCPFSSLLFKHLFDL